MHKWIKPSFLMCWFHTVGFFEFQFRIFVDFPTGNFSLKIGKCWQNSYVLKTKITPKTLMCNLLVYWSMVAHVKQLEETLAQNINCCLRKTFTLTDLLIVEFGKKHQPCVDLHQIFNIWFQDLFKLFKFFIATWNDVLGVRNRVNFKNLQCGFYQSTQMHLPIFALAT